MSGSINLVLMGKSGAGKSSLANYLYGRDLFKTGEGKPLTEFGKKWEMARIDDAEGDFYINIYDSPGLEPDNFSLWKRDFEKNMECRKTPTSWIHGAFYVINAASGRVEPNEIDVIKKFPLEYLFPISIALSNCDSATPEQIEKIKHDLHSSIPDIRINEVCTVDRKKRGGQIVKKFGRKALLKDHAHQVAFYFVNRVGINLFAIDAPKCLNDTFDYLISQIKSSDFGLMKMLLNGPDKVFDEFLDEISKKFDSYLEKQIIYLAEAISDAEDYLNQISDGEFSIPNPMDAFDEIDLEAERKTIVPLLDDTINSLESESVWDKITGTFKVGYIFLTLKEQFIDAFDNIRILILRKMDDIEKRCRERLIHPERYINKSFSSFKW